MNFTSIIYLPFLVITLVLFYVLRSNTKARYWLLLIASYTFYGWWDVRFLSLIIIISFTNYLAGKWIVVTTDKNRQKWILIFGLVVSLGILGYFKYCNFFIESFVSVLGTVGIHIKSQLINIVLPVGISFYTFQAMSYTIDIYRGIMKPTESPLKFFAYVAFFPQLVAGPIVRAKFFLPQLDSIESNTIREEGIFRILYGLCKKLLLADVLARLIVDPAFADPAQYKGIPMLLAIYGYSFQIFLDFSAYTDIAIGSAQLFGFKIPENFRSPYLAADPREFWSRWHISLSTWLRDYLYISLGGNRKGKLRTHINMLITFFLGGLWHGAGMNFIIWGLLHALYAIVYRVQVVAVFLKKIPHSIKVFIFFHLCVFAWIFFRCSSMAHVGGVLSSLTRIDSSLAAINYVLIIKTSIILAISITIHNLIEPRIERLSMIYAGLPASVRGAVVYGFALLLYYASELSYLHSTFIYFQF
ncbi:MAG: MBOAT family O-acyltransferase [Thermodesulfobacteriota bacterium]|nr:MBOAT family O-acyltransferase [Thermodesulfobacteriota bacterium]